MVAALTPFGSPAEWPQTWIWAGRLGWTRPVYPSFSARFHVSDPELMAACHHAAWVVLDSAVGGVWTWAPWCGVVGNPYVGSSMTTTTLVDELLTALDQDLPSEWTQLGDARVLRCARGDILAVVRGDRARRPRRFTGETVAGRRWGVPDPRWMGGSWSLAQVQARSHLRAVRDRIHESGRWRREVLGRS